MKNNIFYAVQYGDNFDWDFGSHNYSTALEFTKMLATDKHYDGLEIRIATINVDNNFCEAEEIIRTGTR